jgi:hypothetical protein
MLPDSSTCATAQPGSLVCVLLSVSTEAQVIFGWAFHLGKLLDRCAFELGALGKWYNQFLIVKQRPKTVL